MRTHKLVPYWVSFKTKYTGEDDWDLTDISAESEGRVNGNTVIDMFSDFCDEYDLGGGDYQNMKRIKNDMEKTFSVDKYEVNGRYIHGILATGTYGIGADHIDTENDELKRGARGPADAVVLPYYFLLTLPTERQNRALLILQKIGNKGTKGVLDEILRHWLDQNGRKTTVKFDPEVTEDLVEQVLESDRLLELNFSKNQSASATHESVSSTLGEVIEEEGFIDQTITFSATRASNLPVAKEKLTQTFFNTETSSITVFGQSFNEGSLRAEVDGSQRTFDLFKDEASMERIIDMEDDDVDLDSDNHPTTDSISEVAIEFANSIYNRYNEGNL